MQIALYQPDIPQNLGSILRLCACMDAVCHIIEPCGFILDDKRIDRVAMDYMEHVTYTRHASWERFCTTVRAEKATRIILFSTKATQSYYEFAFRPHDILLFGRESAGVPDEVAQEADARLLIPLSARARSLNVAQAASMAISQARRQIPLLHGRAPSGDPIPQ